MANQSPFVMPDTETLHVRDVYECISTHFSATRTKSWPVVDAFLRSLEKGTVCADVGCGNGKNMVNRPELALLGSDRSENLIKLCAQQNLEAAVADGLRLPYRSGSLGALISIAVIHHFSTVERRIIALQELFRVLRPGGRGLIFVWSFERQAKPQPQQDALISWTLDPRHAHTSIPAHAESTPKGIMLTRYYHLFAEGELEALLERAIAGPDLLEYESMLPGGAEAGCRRHPIRVVRTGADHENWWAEIQREADVTPGEGETGAPAREADASNPPKGSPRRE
ncbi:putative tRNA methyltransferase [Paratrimastix pyriformis]|uniref:tRNA methyltransferase n=1 Tax=Paratrimastix pyriformis TaxID=342808 RepID=A0ABQ8ULR0_9EUKA|nr:putative tRNA methyltransferase [Paratrimastix pyriformis]